MFKVPRFVRWILSFSVVAFAVPGISSVAMAQDDGADEPIEEIITTGTRRAERSAADSAVPIDVVSGEEFVNMGTSDLNDMLRNTVPSYNVTRQAISDAATLVRPATLRGLPPDNVLILVNGKRRHRSGVIAELGGSLAAGSQGADLSAIPALAIRQTEILRDGAAAQYGSDAIAGVINIVLRDSADGFTAEARTGEYFEGDGTSVQFSANAGFPLGPDGFANVTFQWHEQDETVRSLRRTDAESLRAAGVEGIREPYTQIWGGPEYRDNFNIFVNSGIQLTSSQELYAFGNYGGRETEGDFFFRNPNDRSGVFTQSPSDGDAGNSVTTRAIVDTRINRGDEDFVSDCPQLGSPGSGGDGTVPDNDTAMLQNMPEYCWALNLLLPGGYTPRFGGELEDTSLVGGLRGEFANGISYDFSASFGRNAVDFFLNNTWNPSNGPDGIIQGELQRNFSVGEYIQSETNLNADFVLPIPVDAFHSDLNLAFGAEWRDEVFTIRIGEEASWEAGRFAFQSGNGTNCYEDPNNPGTCDVFREYSDDPVGDPGDPVLFDDSDQDDDPTTGPQTPRTAVLPDLSIGAHGFAGFSPNQAGKFGRSNYAVYTEAEADIVEDFTLAAALRFEDFEDFGTTTNGKLAARWAVTDSFALRASASTGFRAPTPGQSNVTKVSTRTVDGELRQSGQIPPDNPIAIELGGLPLEPEDATNFTAGFVWDATDMLSLTVDYFVIDLEDRISQTGQIDIADRPIENPDLDCPDARAHPTDPNLARCLQELGIPGAADLTSVSFFTNDFATTTTGVDLVATYNVDFGNAGNGALTAAWNWTETEVDDAGEEVSRNRVVDLENFNPDHRGVFTYNHFLGDRWRFLVRASYYDDWQVGDWTDDMTPRGADGTGYTLDCTEGAFRDNCYDGQWIFDVEAAYSFTDNWTAVVGAQNVADEFGPRDKDNLDGTIGSGNAYTTTSPFGFEGGFWYVRLRADFE